MKSFLQTAGTLLLGCALLPKWSGSLLAAGQTPLNEGQRFYIEKIRPILSQKCYKCHTDQPNSRFRVDSREAILEGGKRGPAIVPGDPDHSLLIQAVRQTGELKMPKDGRLEEQEIADLVAWVKMGAPWPADGATTARGKVHGRITDEDRAFWCFQPVRPQAVPGGDDPGWARNPIDRFVLQKLHAAGFTPAP